MRIYTVDSIGMRHALIGQRDRFLHHRRIQRGTVFGWLVLIGSGIGWGWIAAKLMIETWGYR